MLVIWKVLATPDNAVFNPCFWWGRPLAMDFLFDQAFDCIPPKVNRRAKPWLVKHQNWGGYFSHQTLLTCSDHLVGNMDIQAAHLLINTLSTARFYMGMLLGEWEGGGGI